MAHLPPDHRFHAVKTLVEGGLECELEDAVERELFCLLKTNACSIPDVSAAYDLYADPEYRHILNAVVLAGANDDHIVKGLRLQPGTHRAYCRLFFDTSAFPHVLAIKRYVQCLMVSDPIRQIYIRAIERGAGDVIDLYRVGERPRLDPENVMYEILGDSFRKFTSHRGEKADSDAAREALKWGQSAFGAAKQLLDKAVEDNKAKNAMADIQIALNVVDHTSKPASVGIDVKTLVGLDP